MNAAPSPRDEIVAFVRAALVEVTQVDASRIRADDAFEEIGISSMISLQLTEVMERRVPNLPRTLFFEHRTLNELVDYFVAQHAAFFASAGSGSVPSAVKPAPAASEAAAAGSGGHAPDPLDALALRWGAAPVPAPQPPALRRDDIAIVGLAGRYPDAPDLDTFWRNLSEGRDSIREVPLGRWAHERIFDADRGRDDKVYAKWGGFLDDVAGFDPLFFRISPKEAEAMDPQERLFLQAAWHAVEDAGYRPGALGGGKVGVFVGAMWSHYQLYGVEASARGSFNAAGSSFAAIANRVSHSFDFEGPCLALDTMCSSSLTALHLARQSLLAGECDAALAGGVNLTLHPQKYVLLARNNFAATDGRCRAFGAGGDGYVPGEGVGCVVLKRLQDAIAAGDHIHGVIKGTAINHGGHTHGFTVPNPKAQARAVRAALAQSEVEPGSLSYVEAHGTGTALGDPIEIAGLRAAMGEAGCAIGSVKSNIGHLEAAAGIAGLTKVLLQMRHRTLVPSLHTDTLNPNIDWAETPFRVQRTLAPWHPPHGQAMRAGVSAFGAGGSNAHVIVEQAPDRAAAAPAAGPQWLLLSARTEAQLRESAARLASWIERHGDQHALADVAYTLQVGREPAAFRAALGVGRAAQAIEPLRGFAAGQGSGVLFGAGHSEALGQALGGEAGTAFIAQLQAAGQWETLARLWCSGCDVPWNERAWGGRRMQRVPLPGTPFASRRLWVTELSPVAGHAAAPTAAPEPGDTRWLTPDWVPGEPAAAGPQERTQAVVLLLPRTPAARLQQGLAAPLARDMSLVCVQDGPGFDWADGKQVRCDLGDPEAMRRLAQALAEQAVDGVIDAADLGAAPVALRGRVEFLQQLIAARRTPLRLLHLAADGHAGGAADVLQALHASLPREYARVSAGALRVGETLAAAALEAAWRDAWARGDGVARRCTESGRVEQAAWRTIPAPSHRFAADADKVYVVTGGTGGIGLALAQWLVERGARKLALCGLRELPARAHWPALLADPGTEPGLAQRLRALAALDAELRLHAGALSDRTATQAWLAQLREWGPLGVVFHAAGRVDAATPAFVDKPYAAFSSVLEPKVDGLSTLVDAFGDAPPQMLLLFSSVSGVYPELAVGLTDYAAANHALNAFATRAHAAGRPWVRSVVWQNWAEVGLGETRSEAYAERGLLALSNARGLGLLEQALTPGLPAVVFPAVVRTATAADALTRRAAAAASRPAAAAPSAPAAAAPPAPPAVPGAAFDFVAAMRRALAPVLRLDGDEWPADTPFGDLGVDSILIAGLHRALEQWLGDSVDPGLFLEHDTLARLARQLQQQHAAAVGRLAAQAHPAAPAPAAHAALPAAPPAAPSEPAARPAPAVDAAAAPEPAAHRFAIVGMACRFPKAPDLAAFRDNLRRGVDAITEVPASRWRAFDHYAGDYQPGKSIGRWGGFVDDIENFDPAAFEMAPEIAEQVDPLIRLALEACVSSLRDAGCDKDDLKGRPVGVFLGSRVANYAERIRAYHRSSVVGVGQNFIAAHVSQLFDLTGPALVLDSACSSSLLAVHLACRSIAAGECEAAVAGGVDILLDERPYLMLTEGRALSPTGRCKTFDDKADGFVPGEGAGAVVLKALDKAIADGDRIYAVIEGSAVNNDGRTMGITTPNPQMQQAVIRQALTAARADAGDVSYVEAHGTGTRIGDPIELRGLTSVFRADTEASGYCAIGSVKTNIGHLLSAAGIASLIKVALGVAHHELYPTLNCDTPNPRFAFDESPFYVNTELRDWQPRHGARRAGISSFGFGGTNVHLIVSDAHRTAQARDDDAVRRKPLPPLPAARQRHWLQAGGSAAPAAPRVPAEALEVALEAPSAAASPTAAGFQFSKRR